jgi:hypothetical protein
MVGRGRGFVLTYSVTGSAGDWMLDFSVTNNLGGTNAVYIFGVYPVDSPLPLSFISWTDIGTFALVSGGEPYQAWCWDHCNAIDPGIQGVAIQPGVTLSGFMALSSATAFPTSIGWFASAKDGIYTGPGTVAAYSTIQAPFFEGTAVTLPPAIPEPSTWAMLLVGFAGIGFMSYRRSHSANSSSRAQPAKSRSCQAGRSIAIRRQI